MTDRAAERARLATIHAHLATATAALARILPLLPAASNDTCFAMGEVSGLVRKAQAMVERDLYDFERQGLEPDHHQRA